jgi:hypothetical protein
MSVDIVETPIGGDIGAFLGVVDTIYRHDPHYIRPLDLDIKQRLSRRNPFFKHAEGAMFTARRGVRVVGRCTAQIDREHLARYKDDVGFFGFLDTVDDEEVATALLERARHWLKDRGMKKIRGPFSLSINQESGCLVDGFDTPPMVMMAHHRPYQAGLIEKAGFDKIKDLYAWRYESGPLKKRVQKAYDDVLAMPEVTARPVDPKNITADVRLVMDVFNDAWSDNWGFVPYTEAELKAMAREMQLILDPTITSIVSVNGEPAAVALAVPNINAAIKDLGGSLFPMGLPKLLYRLKVRRLDHARLAILGVRKKFRNQRKYAALSLFLYAKLNESGRRNGYRWGELSWTLEDNAAVNAAIKMMGGQIYKTYRIYERDV